MFRIGDHAGGTAARLGLALAAATLLLSVLAHFGADLAWLYFHTAAPETAPIAGAPLPASTERLTLADPGGDIAWLSRAWSAPGRSPFHVRRMLVTNDRALPPLRLFHPPAFPSVPIFARL